MFTPGIVIFYLATILRPDHVRLTAVTRVPEEQVSRTFYQYRQETARWCLGAAGQVLAQGVPPGVPRSYRALAHLCGLIVHEGGT
jgi:hypothetical protein